MRIKPIAKTIFSYPLLFLCFGFASTLVYFYDKSSEEIKAVNIQIQQLEQQLLHLNEENDYFKQALYSQTNILKEKKRLQERYTKNNELLVNLQIPELQKEQETLATTSKSTKLPIMRWITNILILLTLFGIMILFYNRTFFLKTKKNSIFKKNY